MDMRLIDCNKILQCSEEIKHVSRHPEDIKSIVYQVDFNVVGVPGSRSAFVTGPRTSGVMVLIFTIILMTLSMGNGLFMNLFLHGFQTLLTNSVDYPCTQACQVTVGGVRLNQVDPCLLNLNRVIGRQVQFRWFDQPPKVQAITCVQLYDTLTFQPFFLFPYLYFASTSLQF